MTLPTPSGSADPLGSAASPRPGSPNGPLEIDAYAVWHNPDYRLYAAGWFLMAFGKMVETVAVGVHVYVQTREALYLGLVGLVQALPVISVVGGGIATILVVLGAARLWPEVLSIGSLNEIRPPDETPPCCGRPCRIPGIPDNTP